MTGTVLLYSGKQSDSIRESSVRLLLATTTIRDLLTWELVFDRYSSMAIISPPAEIVDIVKKDTFHEYLQAIEEKLPKGLNSKVGCNNILLRYMMGRHGIGERNTTQRGIRWAMHQHRQQGQISP